MPSFEGILSGLRSCHHIIFQFNYDNNVKIWLLNLCLQK